MSENDEIHSYIADQSAKNTTKGTMYDVRTLQRYMKDVGDNRNKEEISSDRLDVLLSKFFIEVRQVNGEEYQQDCLTTIHRGLAIFFEEVDKRNILQDDKFSKSRKVLAAKRKNIAVKVIII